MNRRDVLMLGGTAIAWPWPVRAQQKAVPVIGWLNSGAPFNPSAPGPGLSGAVQGLADTGYIEGRNLAGIYRASEGHDDRLPGLAEELIRLKVDVIAAGGNSFAPLAAKRATKTIPIVFITGGDPLGAGLVANLARPGENVTGVSLISAELDRKRLQLLNELVPDASAIGLLVNPNNARVEIIVREIKQAAHDMGVRTQVVHAGDQSEFSPAFATLTQSHVGAVLVTADALFISNRQQLIDLAARSSLPASYEARDFTLRGGLMSSGADFYAVGRRFGVYLGKVLDGMKPADLPVELPTKFQLVINLKTAKTLGLTVPHLLLTRADEVIE